jgi:lipopolysaccharide transport system permease protein
MRLLTYTTPKAPPSSSPAVADWDREDENEIVICPRTGWIGLNWKELLASRELLLFLVWRDIKVRYKQTALGVAWAMLQPLVTMAIFTFVFGRVGGVASRTGGVPYAVYVFAGLIPWLFFYNGVTWAASSLINQQQILTKIYFPRLFVPTAGVGAFFVDMVMSGILYAFILAWYRIVPSWHIVFLPLVVLAATTATLGLGYALSALTVVYRDLRYAVPFLMQVLMFLSPVIYPIDIIPARFQWIVALNPACAVIDAFRWSVLGTPLDPAMFSLGLLVNAAMFVFGLFYFRKTERFFADIA